MKARQFYRCRYRFGYYGFSNDQSFERLRSLRSDALTERATLARGSRFSLHARSRPSCRQPSTRKADRDQFSSGDAFCSPVCASLSQLNLAVSISYASKRLCRWWLCRVDDARDSSLVRRRSRWIAVVRLDESLERAAD